MTTIRLADASDASECSEIYAPYVRETPTSFESSPPDADEFRARVESTLESHPWLVCEHDGRVVGYAYAGSFRDRDAYRWTVESSVYVDERFHGHGIGRGLYESLFAVLRLQGFHTVCAVTTVPNAASVGLHESMGFEPVGTFRNVGYKHGEWHDVEWLQLRLQHLGDDPDPPAPIGELVGTPELDDALSVGLSDVRR